MTKLYEHPCEHSSSGWCLDCVKELLREKEDLRRIIEEMDDEMNRFDVEQEVFDWEHDEDE